MSNKNCGADFLQNKSRFSSEFILQCNKNLTLAKDECVAFSSAGQPIPTDPKFHVQPRASRPSKAGAGESFGDHRRRISPITTHTRSTQATAPRDLSACGESFYSNCFTLFTLEFFLPGNFYSASLSSLETHKNKKKIFNFVSFFQLSSPTQHNTQELKVDLKNVHVKKTPTTNSKKSLRHDFDSSTLNHFSGCLRSLCSDLCTSEGCSDWNFHRFPPQSNVEERFRKKVSRASWLRLSVMKKQ